MAYGLLYKFIFDSLNGSATRIEVLKNGYSGSAIQRPLGAAPVLRQQFSGCVAGSSLAFTPECRVDGEFSQFYTTDAKEFRVDLYRNNVKIWSGFIVPELYSEPDIAPPYDVSITAADGLGELKRYDFLPLGKSTIQALFVNLLSYTGQSLPVHFISSLNYTGVSAAAFFLNTYMDIDYKAGENCYDVLQYLLATFHARICYYAGAWLIARENDITFTNGKPAYINESGQAASYDGGLMEITAMGEGGLWPVDFTSSNVDPALRSIEVEAPWNLKSGLANSEMLSDTDWTKSEYTTYESSAEGYLLMPFNSLAQSLAIPLGKPMLLTFHAAMYLYGTYLRKPYSEAELNICFTAGGLTYSLASDDQGGLYWDASGTTTIDYKIESGTDRATACENQLTIPVFLDDNGDPVTGTLSIQFAAGHYDPNVPGTQGLWLFGAWLTVAAEKGYKDMLQLNNGARGVADSVTIAVGYETSELDPLKVFYGGILLTGNNALVTSLSTGNFSNLDFLSLISRDYARSIALPRLRTDGTLDTPSSLTLRPLLVNYRGTNRWVETFEWNLLEDNFDFSALSIPSASISVSGEVITATGSAGGSADKTIARLTPGSGEEGEDGLTIMLSNYAHVFEATANGYAKAGTDNVSVRAFRGQTAVVTTVGTITGAETGLGVTKVNNGSTDTILWVSATTSLHSAGTLVIPVTADGVTVNLRYSWALQVPGAPGPQGPAGEDGEDGGPGKSPRGPSDYSATVQYSGIEGTGDFIDYVFNANHTKLYVCIKTPPVGTPLTNTTYWQESTIQDFVATKVFYTEYGYVQNLGANAVKIATTGGTVYGGFMPPSTEGNGNYIFWAGGSLPGNSPFTVDKDGNINAQSGTFSGFLRMPFEKITDGAYQLSTNSYELADKCNLYAMAENLTLYLPCDNAQVGKVVNIWDFPVKTRNGEYVEIRTSVANRMLTPTSYGTYGFNPVTYFNTGRGGLIQLVCLPGGYWQVTINSCVGVFG